MRAILLIAYYFPPYASSGVWRPYFFAKHLAALGWHTTVLTIREEDCIGDESGVELPLPGTIEIRTRFFALRRWIETWGRRLWPSRERVASGGGTRSDVQSRRHGLRCLVSDWVEELLLYPDDQVGWMINAVRAGRRAARALGCDVIYATGTPWSSLLAGAFLKFLLRRPLIVEFRDPWFGNAYHRRKFRLTDGMDFWLERWVLRRADRVVTLTQELGEAMVGRHGLWLEEKLVTVTNGYERLPWRPNRHASLPAGDDPFRVIHAGNLYGKRDVGPLLEALLDWVQTQQLPADGIRLDLIGEVEIIDPKIAFMLEASPLRDMVRISSRVPFTACQQRLEAADLLLIIQPDAPLQIPRKLFDYLAFDKPILAIAAGGATANLMRRERLGEVVVNERGAIQMALDRAYQAFRVGQLKGPQAAARCRYDNAALAKRMDQILSELIRMPDAGKEGPQTEPGDVEGYRSKVAAVGEPET